MYNRTYMTARDAVIGMCRDFTSDSRIYETVTVRGMETREFLHATITILKPADRFLAMPHRKGNPFARIAETMWMLAGRNDLDWLERYIPQCKKWSDDGEVWRAAYGPRLRKWGSVQVSDESVFGIDQLMEVYNKLKKDPATRQAVISIWDPELDWIEGSKDYPCNNWLHFMIRNNRLHMVVGVRSNDLIYGFSHIDFFSWSVMQSLLASWLDVEVGHMTWVASSMHIYERHYEMAEKIAKVARILPAAHVEEADIYAHGFDDELEAFFHCVDVNTLLYDTEPDMWETYVFALRMYHYWQENKHVFDDGSMMKERVEVAKTLAQSLSTWPVTATILDIIEYFSARIAGFNELPELFSGNLSEEMLHDFGI